MKVPGKVRRKLEIPTRTKVRRLFWSQGMIAVGAMTSALAYAIFQVPFKLAAGGVSGLGIIINHYTGISVGMLFLLLNIPLLIWGFFQLGRWAFLASSVLAVVSFSVMADVFTYYIPRVMDNYPITDDLLLASIYAGILYGVGMGLIYRAGGSVGGTSVPARILHNKTGFPMSQAFMFTDLAVIVLAGFVFWWELALLAFLTLLLSGMVTDFVTEGSSQVRTAMIITRIPETVRWGLMKELGRGVSMWNVTGGYTGQDRTMIYCTVRRSQVVDLKFAMQRLDPDAFMVVGVVQQAWGGTGFASLRDRNEKPGPVNNTANGNDCA